MTNAEVEGWKAEVERLRKENDQLREALRKVLKAAEDGDEMAAIEAAEKALGKSR